MKFMWWPQWYLNGFTLSDMKKEKEKKTIKNLIFDTRSPFSFLKNANEVKKLWMTYICPENIELLEVPFWS